MDFANFENTVISQVKKTGVVLFIGAGINGGSTNRHKQEIASTATLNGILCRELGQSSDGVTLADSAFAVESTLGREVLDKILINEFRFTKPSKHVDKLFKYSWKRIYTWNYDDSLMEASRTAVQRVHFYNGMNDGVEQVDDTTDLQLIFLHGMIQNLAKGIVLTEQEYATLLQKGAHDWYKQAAQDIRGSLPIFLGTSLNEPILSAELDRASKMFSGSAGKALLITPDEPSPIRRAALEGRGFIHIRGTLEDFVDWLAARLGEHFSPSDALEKSGPFNESNIGRFSDSDIVAAQSLRQISLLQLQAKVSSWDDRKKSNEARRFLNGFPPFLALAASDIPVVLDQTQDLAISLRDFLSSSRDMFVTVGQAGSGKSTATMQVLIELSNQKDSPEIYEISDDARSVRDAINILSRLNDRPKILFISSLFVFGSFLSDDLEFARKAGVKIVSTCRTSEWREHFERYFGMNSQLFDFKRFGREDYEPLIERLRQYVPAPAFAKLPHKEQINKLRMSKSQLLIALREATESKNFAEIILSEFSGLKNTDVQDLLILVGIGTLARVGLDAGTAFEAYQIRNRSTSFDHALNLLDGIVGKGSNGRLIARHEFYVRDILDQAVSLDRLFGLLEDLTKTFTKYRIPITKHVTRQNSILFRFLLNHSFLRERAERAGDKYAGLSFYSRFEVPFQLDGHFWLQYGLYYQRLGQNLDAILMLQKSVDAFPDNAFAVHALAAEELHEAYRRSVFNSETKVMVDKAVTSLERLDARQFEFYDTYPLVTLGRSYIPVLLKHVSQGDALIHAKDYYARLNRMSKHDKSTGVEECKAVLLTFITTGHWNGEGARRAGKRGGPKR